MTTDQIAAARQVEIGICNCLKNHTVNGVHCPEHTCQYHMNVAAAIEKAYDAGFAKGWGEGIWECESKGAARASEAQASDAGYRLAKLLRDEYWAQTPLDVAKLADEVLSGTAHASEQWSDQEIDAAALAMVKATAEHYGDPQPQNPDLSLTRLLVKAVINSSAAHASEPVFIKANHHPSCHPSDMDLMWICAQCGTREHPAAHASEPVQLPMINDDPIVELK